jgi:hypothetical protein
MIDLVAAADSGAVITLVVVSFVAYLAGTYFRKRPDKVQAYMETIDGSVWLITPRAHRALIASSGIALVATSFAALVGAAWLL